MNDLIRDRYVKKDEAKEDIYIAYRYRHRGKGGRELGGVGYRVGKEP